MKICFMADARSPIAKTWIGYFIRQGYDVTIISSYLCDEGHYAGAKVITIPMFMSSLARGAHGGVAAGMNRGQSGLLAELRTGRLRDLFETFRAWLGPWVLKCYVRQVRQILQSIQPDLVHALRIPYEGLLAAAAVRHQPLLISVWGNDLTLFATGYPMMGIYTRKALRRIDALHCDNQRDLRLAADWGFDMRKPAIVLPGGGGVESDFYFNVKADEALLRAFDVPRGVPLVINPRGFRGYMRSDTFFYSIPLVLRRFPRAFFLAVGFANNRLAENWLLDLGIADSVRLLPVVTREQLASLFKSAQISVSPSEHDGTPNSLLESMAAGCFPVAGDIESIREWIRHGENGLLCDPASPESLAAAVIRALEDEELRIRAALSNRQEVLARADHVAIMQDAEKFYAELAGRPPTAM